MPNATTVEYFPNQIFRDRIQNCSIINLPVAVGASTNNLIISAISGQIIRIVSISAFSQSGSPGYLIFKDGSGGNVLGYKGFPPNTLPEMFEKDVAGLIDTPVGAPLYLDVITVAVFFQIRYITFTP